MWISGGIRAPPGPIRTRRPERDQSRTRAARPTSRHHAVPLSPRCRTHQTQFKIFAASQIFACPDFRMCMQYVIHLHALCNAHVWTKIFVDLPRIFKIFAADGRESENLNPFAYRLELPETNLVRPA